MLVAYLSVVVSSQKNQVFMAQRILEILHRQRKKPASDIRIYTKESRFSFVLSVWVVCTILQAFWLATPSTQFYNFSNKDSFFHLAKHMKKKDRGDYKVHTTRG